MICMDTPDLLGDLRILAYGLSELVDSSHLWSSTFCNTISSSLFVSDTAFAFHRVIDKWYVVSFRIGGAMLATRVSTINAAPLFFVCRGPIPLLSFLSFFLLTKTLLFFSSFFPNSLLLFFLLPNSLLFHFLFCCDRRMANETNRRSEHTTEEIEEVEDNAAPEVIRELGDDWGVPHEQEMHAYWRPLPSHNWGADSASTEFPEHERPSCFYFFWLPVIVVLGAAAVHLYFSRDKIDWSK